MRSAFSSIGGHLGGAIEDMQGGRMFMEVESFTEKLTSPAIGKVGRLKHGPLVEANLALFRASDSFQYTLGRDYFEVASGGFENVRIPAGITVRAEYFYYGEPPIGQGGGIFVSSEESVPELEATEQVIEPARSKQVAGGSRYATVLKYGVGV